MTPGHEVKVAIIGSGFSGLGLAVRLKQSGTDDFVVLERASTVGGTWRDNDYPGCCCDIPSHVYSFSFELNPFWTRGFASQAEIQAYLERTTDKYGVRPHIRFGHDVLGARWDDDAKRWEIETTGGSLTARFLVSAAGPLSDPTIPDLPGLERFAGTVFHSARWDHGHDLTGERVAVIGTGASSIQFVPAIQPRVGMLHLFQRTAPWVVPRFDHEITRAEHWALRWIPCAPRIARGILYWVNEVRVIGFRRPAIMKVLDRIARWHLRRQVPDPQLREKLTPGYVMGCKRILISDDYYPALDQPNVDVRTDGVAEIREHSIVTEAGVELDVDTIVLGTGFRVVDAPIAHRIRGRAGSTLAEQWNGSMHGYKGTTIAGFPNFFYMLGPNTGLGHNSVVYMIESQVAYVVDALRALDRRGAREFDVRPDAQQRYDDALQRSMQGTVWTAGRCRSWYLDADGRNPILWPTWSWKYRRETRRFDVEAYQLAA